MIELDITLLRELKKLDFTKVETYLNETVKSVMPANSMASYAIAYVLVKADENKGANLDTLDSFVETCNVYEEIALFFK